MKWVTNFGHKTNILHIHKYICKIDLKRHTYIVCLKTAEVIFFNIIYDIIIYGTSIIFSCIILNIEKSVIYGFCSQ